MIVIAIAKMVIEFGTSAAVGACAGNVLNAAVPVGGPILKRGMALAGKAILTSMIAHMATQYVMTDIEKVIETVKQYKKGKIEEEPSI